MDGFEVEAYGTSFRLVRTGDSQYDVYHDGKRVAQVYGYEHSWQRMASTGRHAVSETKPRKHWGYCEPDAKGMDRGQVFLPTRKAALVMIARHWLSE